MSNQTRTTVCRDTAKAVLELLGQRFPNHKVQVTSRKRETNGVGYVEITATVHGIVKARRKPPKWHINPEVFAEAARSAARQAEDHIRQQREDHIRRQHEEQERRARASARSIASSVLN